MLDRIILLMFVLITLAGCAGTAQTGYSDKGPYIQQDHCLEPGNCIRDDKGNTSPSYSEYPTAPENTPPVSQGYYSIPHQTPLAPQPGPQEYRYSGVQNGQYHWGRMTVDPDGSYRGWDNKGGFSWGTISPQGYTPPTPQHQPVYPQEYNYSGIQNGELHFGNVTVQPDGSYSGFDSQGGIIYGNVEAQ